MNRWITSDTHFGHANILKYCPWRSTWAASIEEHDAKLIEAWNRTVGPNDVVYHCGDFALVPRPRIAEIRKKLFGRIWLVLGNHDRSQTAMRDSGFATFAVAELEVDGLRLVLRHSPDDFTPEELERAALLLHGHWHGDDHRDQSGVPVEYRSKLVDVGIDARRDIAPALLDDLVREMQGVNAIVFLQAQADIVESREQATIGWRSMNAREKDTTMQTYNLLR